MQLDSTIVGISTASGLGAIAIVRLSGARALEIALALSHRATLTPRHATLSYVYDSASKPIDQTILLYFKAPQSYSGEDICEIHCHGGAVCARLVVERTLELGAVCARSGEFTKRAFLNGRIDLAQAQAVAGLINAQSASAAQILVRQLQGEVSVFVEQVRERLIELLAYSEANIDYSEDLDEDTSLAMSQKIESLHHFLQVVQRDSVHRAGAIEGFRLCIVGKPNVGKSSLLNALVAFDRAIISPLAGTTRDTIEESLYIHGTLVRLIDTAGIRHSEDNIEQIGIERSIAAMESSNIIIALFDSSRALDSEDYAILEILKAQENAYVLIVLNKSDMPSALDLQSRALLTQTLHTLPRQISPKLLEISSKCGKDEEFAHLNPHKVFDAIAKVLENDQQSDALILSSNYQLTQIQSTLDALTQARQKLQSDELELFSYHINEAISAISAISKPYEYTQMLDAMFGSFCLGK
ncbi:tRNA uridine-5-carboxymethylaminomethyl(34) synthesis GTPase MnmE [uncultured Helicobacter sp.]|uniref:tRNA uridine-5-carboxymethylaminomethyl(34) synthesis GTPase MnmE n=1 Tax=uncultured Helicobacter sp. TaxID=175537 RepID=UPI00374F12A3